ncbi:MAG: ABC transporter permease [Rhodococcus sp.]|nr:ABC transporter permease [Rhodococcus sp. (in: high G+C Gram-positive bacteria)]
MSRFILRRLGFVVLTIVLVSILIFFATQVLPGDVANVILGQFGTPEARANLRAELGLDRPLIVQYLSWLGNFFMGDWGTSLSTGAEVRPLVMERLRNSMILAAFAFVLYVPLGIVLGLVAALRRNKGADNVISVGSLVFIGLPEFVSGAVLIFIFALTLHWFPSQSAVDYSDGFWQALPALVLPAVTVSLVSLAHIVRMTRSSTVEVLDMDYVRTAHLKGASASRVLFGHVMRNALLPTVTVISLGIGWLIGGLIVAETVFSYPGLGRLMLYGIERRDLPVIQACAMVVVIVVGVANLVADIIYAALNPRIAYK